MPRSGGQSGWSTALRVAWHDAVVTAAHPGRVALRTVYGTRRVLDMPVGELLPRIC